MLKSLIREVCFLGQEESKTVILVMSPPMTLRNLA